MYLGYFHPSDTHAVHSYSQPHHQLQYGYSGQVPMTPMDMSYSHSMLPANLLSGSASPYGMRQSFIQLQPPSPVYHSRMHPVYNQSQPILTKAQLSPAFPYLTHPLTNSGLDQLNLSRTVIMKNLSSELTLQELLSEIDHGPIEYCKMFETQAPAHLTDVEKIKTCYISFINTHVSVSFHSKYGKNSYNLRALRERLKNSKYLKITLNEPSHPSNNFSGSNNLSKQDFIKLKTLNYITEFNATRAVRVTFKVSSEDVLPALEEEMTTRCSKYGEIEQFEVIKHDEPESNEVDFLVHFTSIDSAIKIYEYHTKRIQIDHLNLIDLEDSEPLPSMCVKVAFNKDRCDRTELNKPRRSKANSSFSKIISSSSSSSVASSPTSSRRPLARHYQPVPENYKYGAGERRREKSSSPLQASSIREEKADDATTSESELVSDAPPAEEDRESLAGLQRSDPSLSKKKNSAESSYSGDLHSVSSMNPSETTEPTYTRSRRYPGAMSDPYLFAQTSQHHYMSQPSIANASMVMGMPNALQYNPDPFNVGNRTLYLGNLHPNTTVEEIANNVRAGGLVESIKFHREKRVCFITFIDPAISLKFFLNHQVLHQLIIHGNEVNVCWGKNHSGQLSREIALAVTAGASRNVYIGIKTPKPQGFEELPDEQTLREDFSRFGEMEQINFYHNKDCGFINFMNIAAAIKVVELFESDDQEHIDSVLGDDKEFYEKYKNFKISFGKDRCGNPPKFSYKKKNSSYDFLRERDLVDMPSPHHDIPPEKEVEPINDEAAMVFGISTEPAETNESPGIRSPPNGYLAESTALQSDSEEEKIAVQPAKSEAKDTSNATSNDSDHQLTAEDVAAALEEKEVVPKKADDADEDDEDDDDDDISIIIGSDITTDARHQKKAHRKHQKFYHHRTYLNEGEQNWNTSRNSSALSLNSSYAKHHNYHSASFSPVIPQPVFYQQTPQFVQQMRPANYYGAPTVGVMPQPHLYHHASFPSPGYHKGPYSVSGSQVMAQYLAKSQHENYLYANSILSNEVSSEEMRGYKKNYRRSTRKHQV